MRQFHLGLNQNLKKNSLLIYSQVPIICTVLISGGLYCSFSLLHYSFYYLYVVFQENVDCTVNFHYCTAFSIIHTVLKKQACNVHKYWSYNRNLRVQVPEFFYGKFILTQFHYAIRFMMPPTFFCVLRQNSRKNSKKSATFSLVVNPQKGNPPKFN